MPPRRFFLMPIVPALLIALGTIGFTLLEDWPALDALYCTVITLTTIGYGDVAPVTTGGRLFAMFLALSGVFTMFYLGAEFVRAVVTGELRSHLGKRRMEQALAGLTDHLIVCGYGRMGRLVCKEFSSQGVPFVIVDSDAEVLADFDVPHGIALTGDATEDEMLLRAGIARARALVTVAPSDADNLFITMSARLLNERLFVVARAEDDQAVQKLRRAGADRVVSPYVLGGARVAHAVLRPTVVDFIDLATQTEHFDLQIEETTLAAASRLAGRTLRDGQLRERLGIIIVAIKKPSGHMVYNPPVDAPLEAGDTLVALGPRQQLDELDALARG